ncbi:MAG: carbon-nitrogen hydrolase family protein [Rhodobacteraceae bacterium]|nr:carbon-nitrogen hydrolase family protein [Paracoccaceae bacterium]
MRCALVQMTSSDQPSENLAAARAFVAAAAADGAGFVLTPEVTNCMSASRRHMHDVLRPEADDPVLAGLSDAAAAAGVWLLIGSLALKPDPGAPDERFANRSFLIGPDGAIVARYDKIHMFDVQLSDTETYRESEGFRPGDRAVLARTPFGAVGMAVCYDLRFAPLFRALAQGGAEILTVPAAFAVPTGQAHWETLLRARAIETGSYVLAPAQVGTHPHSTGAARQTWGHALAVDPWGRVLCDGGDRPGLSFAEIDLAEVAKARARVPALIHDRVFSGP